MITDVSGLLVGNAHDASLKSGSTVLTGTGPFRASVDVMGGAPGTRETDCLDPDRLVSHVDALVLSGGSAFGLDAASGVADGLRAAGRGFAVGEAIVPIVPAAILFDLNNGGDKEWARNPYHQLGADALASAAKDFELGTAGAGYGATTAVLKGGLGSASIVLESGITVGALVAANGVGSPVAPETGNFWASHFEIDEEFGGLGPPSNVDPHAEPPRQKAISSQPRANTTITIVATDAALDKAQLKRVAVAAQDGLARALVPSHTPFDGDLVFAVSTDARPTDDAALAQFEIGHAAAVCLSRALCRGVFHAHAEPGDVMATWQELWGDQRS